MVHASLPEFRVRNVEASCHKTFVIQVAPPTKPSQLEQTDRENSAGELRSIVFGSWGTLVANRCVLDCVVSLRFVGRVVCLCSLAFLAVLNKIWFAQVFPSSGSEISRRHATKHWSSRLPRRQNEANWSRQIAKTRPES